VSPTGPAPTMSTSLSIRGLPRHSWRTEHSSVVGRACPRAPANTASRQDRVGRGQRTGAREHIPHVSPAPPAGRLPHTSPLMSSSATSAAATVETTRGLASGRRAMLREGRATAPRGGTPPHRRRAGFGRGPRPTRRFGARRDPSGARVEACRRGGQEGHSLVQDGMASEVGWATVMAAVVAVGVDKTAFRQANAHRHRNVHDRDCRHRLPPAAGRDLRSDRTVLA